MPSTNSKNQAQEVQARLSAIVASSDDAIMSKTLEGVITSWNPAAENIFGYTEEEAVGQPMSMLLPANRKHEETEILAKIAQGKRIEHFETVRVRKDGTTVDISASISPMLDSEGNVYGASKIARDITDKKEIEETRARFSAIVTSSDDAIISKTLKGIITSWNPAAESIFGYTEKEAIGQPMSMLLPANRKHEEAEILAKIARGKRIEHFETVRVRKDGTTVDISASISPMLDSEGNVYGASKIARDITNKKEIEKELNLHRERLEELVALATSEVNAILQTAVNGVISIDERGIIHLFNPAAEKLFGWKSKEVVGKNVSMLMPEPYASSHNGFLKHFINTGEKHIIGIGREITGLCKDGTTFPGHLAVGHAELSGGAHLFVAFIADISLQKQSEQELLKAKNNAEAAVKAKANFLANMSHEIRTPMNAIIGFAELALQDNHLPPESRGYVKTILGSGRHLLAVINDILDFSKIEAGKISIENVCFHLPNAVQDALHTIEFRAIEKGLKIILNVSNDLSPHVMGDPTRLRQVILNLVSNAIKFTEKGLITVSIQKGKLPDMLHFTVTDTGIGMSQEQVNKVFKSFVQADTSTTRRYGGTGLGTTISKQIVELMGGEIWVDSIEGKGSSFHFTTRLAIAKNIEHSLYKENESISTDFVSPRCFKVLLAEDIEANATLVILRLSKLGHEVTWVKNGQEAVDAFNNHDLILMDIQMPVLDGMQATEIIRSLEGNSEAHIPIIALTASVMKEDIDQCFDAGMDRVVGKPIDFNELLTQMEKLVPSACGTPNTPTNIAKTQKTDIDFTPLHAILDIKKGLAMWHDPLVYAKALVEFSENRSDNATEIENLLTDRPDNPEAAHHLTHALKGVAGNLALTKIYPIADKINDLIKTGDRTTMTALLSDLEHALSRASAAIALLQIPEQKGAQERDFNIEKVSHIIQDLYKRMDSLNPDDVELLLTELGNYIEQGELSLIQKQVDNFDFDEAKRETLQLAYKFRIPIR